MFFALKNVTQVQFQGTLSSSAPPPELDAADGVQDHQERIITDPSRLNEINMDDMDDLNFTSSTDSLSRNRSL
jgi:hypothetical protein